MDMQEEIQFENTVEMGLEWMVEGEYDQALDSFRQALQMDPRASDVYLYMGDIFVDRKEMENALECYEEALRTARSKLSDLDEPPVAWWLEKETRPYLKALQSIAHFHYRRHDYEEATPLYIQLLNLNPHDSLGVTDHLGEAYLYRGEARGAMELYELTTPTSTSYFNYGIAFWMDGQREAARRQFELGIKTNPFFPYLLLALPVPEDLDQLSFESPDQERFFGQEYLERTVDLWQNQPGLIEFFQSIFDEKTES